MNPLSAILASGQLGMKSLHGTPQVQDLGFENFWSVMLLRPQTQLMRVLEQFLIGEVPAEPGAHQNKTLLRGAAKCALEAS